MLKWVVLHWKSWYLNHIGICLVFPKHGKHHLMHHSSSPLKIGEMVYYTEKQCYEDNTFISFLLEKFMWERPSLHSQHISILERDSWIHRDYNKIM